MFFNFKAVADANRQKAVLEIKIQENIIEVEGKKNVSLINNEILQVFYIIRCVADYQVLQYILNYNCFFVVANFMF